MPITFMISESPKLCFAQYKGLVTQHELIENYGQYVAHEFYEPGIPELIDLSACNFTMLSVETLTPLAKAANMANVAKGVCTDTCIYSPNEMSQKAAQMYIDVCGDMNGITIHVSETEKDALEHLNLDYPDFAGLKSAMSF